MTNSKQEYNDFVRANLPGSIRYDSVRNRYVTANNKYFVTYKEAKWYVDYLVKRGSNLAYAEGGYTPSTILDYSGQKSYVGGNLTSSFSDVVTATRTGLATQLDASGNLVWNAHNLLLRSQEFDNAQWSKTNATVTANSATAPDGTNTADVVSFSATTGRVFNRVDAVFKAGDKVTLAVWVRSDTLTSVPLGINGRTQAANNIASVVKTVSSTITKITQEFTVTVDDTGLFFLLGYNQFGTPQSVDVGDLEVWGAHLYRSDLGGMAPVPLTRRVAGSTTYVPTTSAAVYLPREEAYTYVSGSLVGPYYQKESDARTNLVTYSVPNSINWTESPATITSASLVVAPDGSSDAVKISTVAVSDEQQIVFDPITSGAGIYTIYAFFKDAGEDVHPQIRPVFEGTGVFFANFNLTTGAVGNTGGTGFVDAGMVEYQNGWYLCYVVGEYANASSGFGICLSKNPDTDGEAFVDPNMTYTGDGSGFYMWGSQAEQGSTPTSYIPTSGSTVTRSADSTTISAGNMPYPTPQVIGPELVTNGTFDTDFTGWTQADLLDGNASNYSVVSQEARIQSVIGGTYGVLKQSFTTVIGQLYNISFEITPSGSNNNGYILRVGTTDEGFDVLNGSYVADLTAGVTETISKTFIATSTTTHITIGNNSLGNTLYNDFDNISVREINPLALSFQLEGLMTYANVNNPNNVVFSLWQADVNNLIRPRLTTNGTTTTGQLQFGQTALGTNDTIFGPLTSYSPGINVPFNIASRHGSTFINGAVDGTALTANTTPTALPDLSATTFDLAPTFNGFIKEFRVWADDLSDAGIAEAST